MEHGTRYAAAEVEGPQEEIPQTRRQAALVIGQFLKYPRLAEGKSKEPRYIILLKASENLFSFYRSCIEAQRAEKKLRHKPVTTSQWSF